MNDYQNNVEEAEVKESTNYGLLVGVVVLVLLVLFVLVYLGMKAKSLPDSQSLDRSNQNQSQNIIEESASKPVVREQAEYAELGQEKPKKEEKTKMTVEEAITYYKDLIVAKGGYVVEVKETGDKYVIVAETADVKSYVVNIEEVEGKAVVTIMSDVSL